MLKYFLIILSLALSCAAASFASGVNENDLFSTDTMITQSTNTANAEKLPEKNSVKLSGEITGGFVGGIATSTSTSTPFYSTTVTNLFLDARLQKGMKVFANGEADYLAQTRTTNFYVREMFFDINYDNKVYFRTGKQVLVWGTNYFWNPTDLINVEKVPFIQKIGYREGAYGTKMHIPFGTTANLYGFLDTGGAQDLEDAAGALKFEFLTGKTEMAFSGWIKRTYNPVLGYDFSTRVSRVDIRGEASVSDGDNTDRLSVINGVITPTRRTNELIPEASLGFTKYYNLGNYKDRVSVTTEFFYDGAGYQGNNDIFSDKTIYQFSTPFTIVNSSGVPVTVAAGTKKDYFLGRNLYTANYYGQYYGAFFTTVDKFVFPDMQLLVNCINNFSDSTGILSAGVTYSTLNDITSTVLFNTFYGAPDGEYTYSGVSFAVQATITLKF
jgi:hypothetical protein